MRMNMKLMLVLMLSLVLMGSVAFADKADKMDTDAILDLVAEDVAEANAAIDALVADAIAAVDSEMAANLDDPAEYEKEFAVIIADLLSEVADIAEETISEAAELGVTVTCELIEVEIGGTTVMIDPLIVGGF